MNIRDMMKMEREEGGEGEGEGEGEKEGEDGKEGKERRRGVETGGNQPSNLGYPYL